MGRRVGDIVKVHDSFQTGYSYRLSVPEGGDFSSEFIPAVTPKEMLQMGVFEGKYCNDCRQEFPANWFEDAKMSDLADERLNYFGVKSRQSLSVWKQKGWILGPDPRGWFQWYCRYYLGRRIDAVDQIQIRRWKGFARHAAQVRKNCRQGDIFCRPRQRQALLQWAYDPLI